MFQKMNNLPLENNFLIIDRFATEFEDFDDHVFPLYLTKVKSLSVQYLSDEEIVKIFNDFLYEKYFIVKKFLWLIIYIYFILFKRNIKLQL